MAAWSAKTNLFPDLRCQEIPADLTGCRLCVSQHFVITSFPNTVKRFEVNVSLLFFFYTFQNGSNVFGMLNSTRNNSQLQSEKGLLEKILQIKKIHNIYTLTCIQSLYNDTQNRAQVPPVSTDYLSDVSIT